MNDFTIDELRRIMREGAGEDESAGLDGDVLTTRFDDLGYDSLALLETAARIQRERGIKLDDSVVVDASTPGELIALVNERLSESALR